jgi:hypothetical protein
MPNETHLKRLISDAVFEAQNALPRHSGGDRFHFTREDSRIIAGVVFDALNRARVLVIEQPSLSNPKTELEDHHERAHDMSAHVIVWDIETIRDRKGFAAATGHEGKSDADVREEMGNKFPKHIYPSIICIGALVPIGKTSIGRWMLLVVRILANVPRRN